MSNKTVYEAAYKGDFDFVRNKLDEDKSLLTAPDLDKRLLIHWAAVGGNVKLVTYLIELGSPLEVSDDTDTTPIILASSAGHTKIVKMLIEKGVNINHQSTYGHSSLQYAASKGWLEICDILLKNGADINMADSRGGTPLHRAASKGNTEVVKLFMNHLDKLKINLRDNYGNSALHLACEEDRQEEAIILVENGADIELLNKEKQTPLDLCNPKLANLLKMKVIK